MNLSDVKKEKRKNKEKDELELVRQNKELDDLGIMDY